MTVSHTLKFASEDGAEVVVSVTAPNDRAARLGAIEAALGDRCRLYALRDPTVPTRARFLRWWGVLALGCGIPLAAYASLFWLLDGLEGRPGIDPIMKSMMIVYLLPFFCVFGTAFFAVFEWQIRAHHARVARARDRHAAPVAA